MSALKDNSDFHGRPHRPVLYELVDKDGKVVGQDWSAAVLAEVAKVRWPDQEQDEERTGRGWDVQVADKTR